MCVVLASLAEVELRFIAESKHAARTRIFKEARNFAMRFFRGLAKFKNSTGDNDQGAPCCEIRSSTASKFAL